jgi:hypothetical protein
LALAASDVQDEFCVLTRHGSKLYVHQYSAATNKLVRKIKSGSWEGGEADDDDDASAAGLCVSKSHVVVRTSAGIRIMDPKSGKKMGKIKAAKGSGGGKMVLLSSGVLAVLQNSGAAVLYSLDTCAAIAKVPHEDPSMLQLLQHDQGAASSSSSYALLVDQTIYTIQGSTYDKRTQLTSKHPLALFLPSPEKVLCLIHQKRGGCQAQWIHLDDEDLASTISLDDVTSEPNDAAKRKQTTEPTMLGPGQAGTEMAPPTKRIKAAADDDEDGDAEKKTEEETARDLSIAERLQQLSKALEDEDDEDDDDDEMEVENTNGTSFKPKTATTESLKELLSQALQSSDDSLLELALAVRDVKVISTTIKEIEPSLLLVLLSKLTTRLASNPLRAESLSMWLSFLLKTGRFQPNHLSALRNLLYERIESFSDLLRLEGRLSMMCDVE